MRRVQIRAPWLLVCCIACGPSGQAHHETAPRHNETQGANDNTADEDDDEKPAARPPSSQPNKIEENPRTVEQMAGDQVEKDWCMKDLNQSGDYNVILRAVPTRLNGLAQCEDFPVGTKLPLHYRIEHDVDLKRVQVENVDNPDAIIRNIKTVSDLLDECKNRGHSAIVTAVGWTEYPIASKAYQQRGYAWSMYLTVARAPTGQAMVIADAVLVDKYNHSLCHASFDRDDH